MSYYTGLTLVFLLALVEASVLPLFRLHGLQPNLVLVLLVAWLAVRRPQEAYLLVPFAGICLGLVDGAPMGVALLALAPLLVLHDLAGGLLRQGGLAMASLLVLGMTPVFHGVLLVMYTLQGGSGSWLDAFRSAVLPVTALNLLLLLPAYGLLTLFSQERRPVYA